MPNAQQPPTDDPSTGFIEALLRAISGTPPLGTPPGVMAPTAPGPIGLDTLLRILAAGQQAFAAPLPQASSATNVNQERQLRELMNQP